MLVIVAPGQGAQTPGFLSAWLEDPVFAARIGWLSAVSGLDLAHYGTEADGDTIRDTKIAQPLLVALLARFFLAERLRPRLEASARYNEYGSAAGDFQGEWQGGMAVSYALFTGGARGHRSAQGIRADVARDRQPEDRVLRRTGSAAISAPRDDVVDT